MDHDKLHSLLQLLDSTSVSELEYADSNWKVKLTRGLRARSTHTPVEFPEAAAPVSTAPVDTHRSSQPKHVMTAGLTGTFYRAPAPDQPSFVSIGDTVHEGQIMGVVEAMKLLNTIEADRAGRVIEIFADDGSAVLPDSMLFAIEPLEVAHV